MKERIISALAQESTWRGIIALVAAFGIHQNPAHLEEIVAAAFALIGTINVAKNK